MKKTSFIFALIGVTMFSCQKPELSEGLEAPVTPAIQKILSVSDAEWTSGDVKSTFVEGVGITLSGTENISVFYAEGAAPVVAVPAGNGKYSFSHPEVAGVETYDYNYLMPHSAATKADGTARLFAVQYPGAGTYDPAYDFLLGQPSLDVPKSAAEVEVSRFKRLSAPFNFVINDEFQLLKKEAVKVVTVDFSASAEPVAADFVATFSSDYAAAGISGTVSGTGSTALTAVYPEGLPFENNLYNVWFSSLPVELKAGQVVSLTISTKTMTLTCKGTIPSDFTLKNDKLNQIPFKLSRFKTDYANVKSQTSVYAEGASVVSNSGSLEVPKADGYRVSNMKVYAQASSFASASTLAELVVKSGEKELARKAFNLANTADMNGGCVEFDNLGSYTDLAISFVTGDSSTEHAAAISAITTLLVEADQPEFTFPERLVRCGGEDLVLPCTAPSKVTKVSLVSSAATVETTIKSAADGKLTVTIPANAAQGVYDVKVTYTSAGAEVQETIGSFSMALDGGDYYRWDNITVYAQNNAVAEKVFCLETGMMVTIDWVKEHEIPINMANPGAALNTLGNQPRGYHYIMVRGYDNYLSLINPNAWNTIKGVFYTSDKQTFEHYALPMVRYSCRIEKEPYGQNQAFDASKGGNTTHTPGAAEIACYDAVKSGTLTFDQWKAVANDFAKSANNYGLSPNLSKLSSGKINCYGHSLLDATNILLDSYTPDAAYWQSLEQARNGWAECFNGGVVLWSALVGTAGNVGAAGSRYMNGALELVSYTGAKGTERTQGSVTMNVFRRKTGYEENYSYDPNMPN